MTNNGKTKSDKDKKSLKSRIAAMNRSVASSKYIAKEFKAQHGLDTKKLDTKPSDWFKAYNLAIRMKGGSGGKTISNKDFMNALKKVRDAKKKGKPHLKHGGKAKKMRTYKKGGKV